jgi:circadian clock protein KaiC
MSAPDSPAKAGTGIPGLDDVLGGGLPRSYSYVLQGTPGTGKTTIGLQFLLFGHSQGETGLYLSLSETDQELRESAASHGWPLDGIAVHEVALPRDLEIAADTTLFHPAEIELGETMASIVRTIERVNPSRVVIDSLSEIRLLTQNPLRYRRQLLALKDFLAKRQCTALLLDDAAGDSFDMHLQTIAHGVIRLEQLAPIYGAERRRLLVQKLRGVRFRGGYHDYRILTGGVEIYPRLVAAEHFRTLSKQVISSGISTLDEILGGGLERGTTALVLGPAGTGKSAIVAQYATNVASRGDHAVMFTFDEGIATLTTRAEALGMPLKPLVESERVRIRQIDPAELSPGEFTHQVRQSVEREKARLIVIDSLSGYYNAMPEERLLSVQLHELFTYLRQQDVVVLLTLPQHGFVGPTVDASIDVSYLADTVLLLRYFEVAGEIRKAISVVKKRSGRHDSSIRELSMDGRGLRVGPALKGFQGILTGTTTFTGAYGKLFEERDDRPKL